MRIYNRYWTIYSFGDLEVKHNNTVIHFVKLQRRMVEYLTFHESCRLKDLYDYVYRYEEDYDESDDPEDSADPSYQKFSQLLQRINQKFGSSSRHNRVIERGGQKVFINQELARVDVMEFIEATLYEGDSTSDESINRLNGALKLYSRGIYLADHGKEREDDEEWIRSARLQLEIYHTNACRQLTELYISKKAYADAFDTACRWMSAEQPDPESTSSLIQSFIQGGRNDLAQNILRATRDKYKERGIAEPQEWLSIEKTLRPEDDPYRSLCPLSDRASLESVSKIINNLEARKYTYVGYELADLWGISSQPKQFALLPPRLWPSTGAIGEGPIHFSNGYVLDESDRGRRGYALNTSLVAYTPFARIRPECHYLLVTGWAAAISVGEKGEWADRRVRGAFTDAEQIGEIQCFDGENRKLQALPVTFPSSRHPNALKLADTKGLFNGRPDSGQIHSAGLLGAASLDGEVRCEDPTERKCADRWLWLAQVRLPVGTHCVRFVTRTFTPDDNLAYRHVILVIGSIEEWERAPVLTPPPGFHLPHSESTQPDIKNLRELYRQALRSNSLLAQWKGVDQVLDFVWEARNDYVRLPDEEFQEIVHDIVTLSIQRFDTPRPQPEHGDVGGFWRRIADTGRHIPGYNPTEIASWYRLAADIGEQDQQFSRFDKLWIAECLERAALLHLAAAVQPGRSESSLREAATCFGRCAEIFDMAYRSDRIEPLKALQRVFSWEADFLHSDKTDMRFRRQIEREILNLVEGKGN